MRRSTSLAPLALAGLALAALAALGSGCAPADDDLAVYEHELTVCARGTTVEGIDVSSWQGSIDWDAVAGTGIGFAIVRIGDGTYRDRYFQRNWDEARRVGLIRGAYQFFRPDVDPIVQADIVVEAVGRLGPGDLPVTIDVEAPSPGVSPATYVARIRAWVDRVTAGTGREPIVYTGRYYWDPYVASSAFNHLPLWHAQYTSAACPNINDRWSRWTFWQYTSSGRIAGISGNIDRDVFDGSLAALRAFATVEADDDGDGVTASRDCDDRDPRRFPGNPERCDGVDNDCAGGVDDDLARVCGTDVGECVAGMQRCAAGAWGACVGAVEPSPETCDARDEDCDGDTDEEQVCEREEAMIEAALLGPSADTDVDGDGAADACARHGEALECLLASPHGFSRVLSGPRLPSAEGWAELPRAWSLRMADVDGDGRADLCGRTRDRIACWLARAEGFGEQVEGPLVDASATFFDLADVDGDGAADACVRDRAGLHCALWSGHGFARALELAALSDAGGFADVVHHGSLRLGDVDGDGRTDVCARDAEGVDCWLSLGDRFGERVRGPRWSDRAGFDELSYWSTLRLADVTGDGRAELCARTEAGFRCAIAVAGEAASLGASTVRFEGELAGPAMSAARGWERASVYTTLRMGDVDGDGQLDACARESDRVRCWLNDGHGFSTVVLGPALAEAEGWDRPALFRSLRLADVDGDGRADLCARPPEGLRCYASRGASREAAFDDVLVTPAWSDGAGLGEPAALASVRVAGGNGGRVIRSLEGSLGCSASAGRGRSEGWLAAMGVLVALALRRRASPARGPHRSA